MGKHLRKGDEVVVIAGNDKGKVGKVLARSAARVTVEGVNVRKKHLRKTQENPQGRIVDMECAIHISNVMASDGENGFRLRVDRKKSGEKELFYLKDGKKQKYRLGKKEK